jgi:uncharacterized protein YllA (UPF0747 family)
MRTAPVRTKSSVSNLIEQLDTLSSAVVGGDQTGLERTGSGAVRRDLGPAILARRRER